MVVTILIKNTMRRFDKKKNILEANLRLEESFIGSKKLILEDQNPDTSSDTKNICDIMTVNSWDEILELLNTMDSVKGSDKIKKDIKNFYQKSKEEMSTLSNDEDIMNTYLRKIQNELCK